MIGRARIYVCGVTPYDVTHLGHAATYVWVDVVDRRTALAQTPGGAPLDAFSMVIGEALEKAITARLAKQEQRLALLEDLAGITREVERTAQREMRRVRRIDDLHRAVDEVSAALGQVDRRVDDTVSKTAIVRYDAYENSGGHQSASVAMLDSSRTGVVLSAIQGRDYARIYVKELDRGRAAVALSPEELEAVERAMSS